VHIRCVIARVVVLLLMAALPCVGSGLHSDERLVLFPSCAWQQDGGWEIELHGRVYESERARVLGSVLRRVIGIDQDKLSAEELAIYRERTRYFLADNERAKIITLEMGSQHHRTPATSPNGHFRTVWHLSDAEFAALPQTGNVLRISALLRPADRRSFSGEIHVLSDRGLSVISDIDDTIKISEVRDRHALLLNTFCRSFKATPGMPDFYRKLAAENAQFHYVTASPWQLYEALSAFLKETGFPQGSFHMKYFRLKDSSFLSLFGDPIEYKLRTIIPLIDQSPHRQFILIGDSGEKDPEVYGELARTYPDRITSIFIRNVTNEEPGSKRLQAAFQKVPPSKWRLFAHPEELENTVLLHK
jgi:hypothetical protein